ncbi:MAG: cytochrome c-type biogenesis protein CcmH [Fidelibacterota bacterium]
MKFWLPVLVLLSGVLWASDPEALIVDLEKSLMAPCCWGGTVYDHGHPEMEQKIRQFVYEGKTKEQIMNYFVGVYGERIRAVPVASGFNLLAWITPVVIGIIGLGIIFVFIRTPKSDPKEIPAEGSSTPYDDQIEKELKDFDA